MSETITILADQPLHLPIYQKILQQKGSCTGIDLQTFSNLVPVRIAKPRDNVLKILYEYKKRLEKLDKNNLFYQSRSDYDFLKACHSFLTDAAVWNIRTLPESTQKDRDLGEVLSLLKNVALFADEEKNFKTDDQETFYYLKTNHPISQWPLIDLLEKQGAKAVGRTGDQQRYFWSASTPRKAMECAARAIIDNRYNADEVFIALANESERHLLAQVLEARGIPYTFLNDPSDNRIVTAFRLLCSALMNQTMDSRISLIQYLFPETSRPLINTLNLFDELPDLENVEWQPNAIVSSRDFERIRSDALQAASWAKKLDELEKWSVLDLEKAAGLIQDAFAEPAEKDLRTFSLIMDQYAQIKNELKDPEDLSLFMHSLDMFDQAGSNREYKGVLAGNIQQISALRPVCFLMDANGNNFPAIPMKSGIFDEAWYARTEYISLASRMKRARGYLYEALAQPQVLYVISAQADAQGKSLDQSAELAQWMGMQPVFQYPKDYDIHQAPSFSLTARTAMKAMAPQDVMMFAPDSAGNLKDCPLKYLLSSKMKLHSPFSVKNGFVLRSDLIAELMDLSLAKYGQPFSKLSRKDQLALISLSFDFARSLFPNHEKELNELMLEALDKVSNITSLLDQGARKMNVSFTLQNPSIDLQESYKSEENGLDDLSLEIKGPLAGSSSRVSIFSMMDNQPDSQNASFLGLENAPAGTIAVPLSRAADEAKAYSLSYRGKSTPVQAEGQSQSAMEKSYFQNFYKESTIAQNLKPDNELSAFLNQKVKTYEQAADDALNSAKSVALMAAKGDFKPDHAPEACARCRYKAICRNAAREVK